MVLRVNFQYEEGQVFIFYFKILYNYIYYLKILRGAMAPLVYILFHH